MDKSIETKNIDGMNSVERFLKRTGDLLGAFLLLILLSPVFLIIYVMQKIEGEGPAIFACSGKCAEHAASGFMCFCAPGSVISAIRSMNSVF